MKFYIVDDDTDAAKAMTVMVEDAGHAGIFNCAAVFSLPEILSLRPDCVLIDLMMAEMNGLELCEELRGRPELNGLKIIMVSAKAGEYWQERAREAGADGYIAKPLNPKTFVGQVHDILEATRH